MVYCFHGENGVLLDGFGSTTSTHPYTSCHQYGKKMAMTPITLSSTPGVRGSHRLDHIASKGSTLSLSVVVVFLLSHLISSHLLHVSSFLITSSHLLLYVFLLFLLFLLSAFCVSFP